MCRLLCLPDVTHAATSAYEENRCPYGAIPWVSLAADSIAFPHLPLVALRSPTAPSHTLSLDSGEPEDIFRIRRPITSSDQLTRRVACNYLRRSAAAGTPAVGLVLHCHCTSPKHRVQRRSDYCRNSRTNTADKDLALIHLSV